MKNDWNEDSISKIVERQRISFYKGSTRDLDRRITQLKQLREAVIQYEDLIMDSLKKDLNKSNLEAYTTEIGMLLKEISLVTSKLKGWAKPKRSQTALTHVGSTSYVIPEPYGVVLIIAPWNYPFLLAISPLVGAIAAGNTAIIKPSELTPHVSAVIEKIITNTFDEDLVSVIQGGVKISQILLKQRLDYIFFTGSVAVGKIVMREAANQLIPVTLELGGKSPCIVHRDANLEIAAKRIAFGKFTNAGQTCIAPDYLLVDKEIKSVFLEKLEFTIKEFYGDALNNPDYGRIVNESHFDRLSTYLRDGEVIFGGGSNKEELKMEPTILDQVSLDSAVMKEEIFGPIFPVVEYETLEDAIALIQSRPKPLALYLFSESQTTQAKVTENISFGGGCINDTLMHIATPYLPFGGVGESGIGSYHGEFSFSTFSHYKSILKQTTKVDLPFRYPTFKNGLAIVKKLLK
ncbi:aldehyde dehydrogenase [Bacillus sp. DJP31]|uniref:aldehyde dehydrogenase n=1 Tax=Bacillus sp. DJP31 TaxID=3409789 RepID=UPI003BB65F84